MWRKGRFKVPGVKSWSEIWALRSGGAEEQKSWRRQQEEVWEVDAGSTSTIAPLNTAAFDLPRWYVFEVEPGVVAKTRT